jgi:hypothetical protein
MLYGLSNLFLPKHGRAIRVSEGCVFSMGEDVLHGLEVPFQELT